MRQNKQYHEAFMLLDSSA